MRDSSSNKDATIIKQVTARDYLLGPNEIKGRPLHAIVIEVCEKHRISLMDFVSKRRHRYAAYARQEFFYRARHETTASFPEIGRCCGNRDHTTVIYGMRRHEARMKAEAAHGTP